MRNFGGKIKIIMLAGFLFAFHLALVSYINSSFLATFVSEKIATLIFPVASIASILGLLLVPKVLPRLGGYRFLLSVSLLDAIALLMLAFSQSAYLAVPVFILYWLLNSMVIFSIDELLEIMTVEGSVGKTRGLYLTLVSLAWVIAEFLGSQLLVEHNFSFLYLIASSTMFIFFSLILLSMGGMPDPGYDKLSPFRSIKKFFRSKNLSRAYLMNFLLQFFFSWMVIYTPIYLSRHLSFTWSEITLIFSFMLTAFVLVDYPLGRYSDRCGERGLLIAGFLVASGATLSLFFIQAHSLALWAILLFSTRLGAAAIEVMSDVYFFKHIEKENDEFIGIYRNTGALAYILGPLLASLFLLILPDFKYIFIVLAVIMLSGAYLAHGIKKSDI